MTTNVNRNTTYRRSRSSVTGTGGRKRMKVVRKTPHRILRNIGFKEGGCAVKTSREGSTTVKQHRKTRTKHTTNEYNFEKKIVYTTDVTRKRNHEGDTYHHAIKIGQWIAQETEGTSSTKTQGNHAKPLINLRQTRDTFGRTKRGKSIVRRWLHSNTMKRGIEARSHNKMA